MAAEVQIDIIAKDNFSSTLGNFGNIMTGLLSTVDLLGRAFNAAAGFIQPFIDSASDSELAFTRLQTVFDSTNGTLGLTLNQLTYLAEILQDSTRFSDEDIMGAEAMLLRFENLTSNIFPQVLSLSTDLAEALGVDLTAASRMLGMALDDPTEGIGRLNAAYRLFTDAEIESIQAMAEHGDVASAQAIIMERLTEKFGGTAEAVGNTFAGQLEIATNKLDDMKEKIGGALLPVLVDLLEKFIEFAESPAVQGFLDNVVNGLNTLQDVAIDISLGELTQEEIDAFLSNLDTKLADALENFNWSAAGDAFGDSLVNAITNSSESNRAWYDHLPFVVGGKFILGLLRSDSISALASGISQWFLSAMNLQSWGDFLPRLSSLYEAGINIGQSIGEGIRNGLQNSWIGQVDDWLYDNIVEPIKRILGISSPSTVFFGIGRDLMQGFLNGLMSMVGDVLGLFENLLALFGIDINLGTGGTTGGRSPTTPDPRGGGLPGTPGTGGGNVLNFYGPVYVGSIDELMYDCAQTNPLLQAGVGAIP